MVSPVLLFCSLAPRAAPLGAINIEIAIFHKDKYYALRKLLTKDCTL